MAAGCEASGLIAAKDWSGTSLGPRAAWSRTLTITLAVVLRSPVPMVLLWGEDGVMLYNDAYASFAGGRHPGLLGTAVREGWPEAVEFNSNVMSVVLAGETLSYTDQEMALNRNGAAEQVWMNLDYSPVADEAGRPVGVLCVVAETTQRVKSERRRQEAEIAVRAERDRAQGVLDNMDEAFVLLDHEFRFVDLNQEALRLENRPKEEVLGKTHWEAHPEASPKLGKLLREAMRERRAVSMLHHYVWPHGQDSWIDMRAYPVSCGGLAVFYRDVSDQQRTQAALEEREHELQTLTDALPVLISYIDRERRYRFINKVYETWFSARREEILGKSVEEVVGTAAYQTVAHHIDAAMRGERIRFEQVMPYADISPRAIQVEYVPRIAGDGNVLGLYTLVQDITERKAAEAQLRELNDTLERRVAEQAAERNRVWQMSRDLLAVMGFDGTLKAINPAWTRILGFDEATLLSRPFSEQVHPDDHASVRELVERLQRGEMIERFDDRLLHADGSWRWIAWSCVPEGDVFYAVGRDVTPERQRQAELEAAQDALRQSQKMESMGQLTGGVAHDFNNLLTPIVGALDMLQRSAIGSEREQRLIAGAAQSADRAKTLVQRLLAFARRQPLQPVAVDIGKLVEGMAELVSSTSGPQIRLVVECEPSLPAAKADPNQLEMALLNLCVNSRDAMPQGGTLSITAQATIAKAGHRSALPPGRYVRLAVADTGAGMDEDTIKRAVEPFFSTKGLGRGTGLGLSMVHGLALQLGGALTLQSRPGLGTNIEMWLPVSAQPPAELDETESGSATLSSARGAVLLVDDEELVRMSTADMLAGLGYDVREVGSGEEALHLVQQGFRPDLLVTDHLMPGMNGTDLARHLQRRWPRLPILIISGYADHEGVAPDLPRLTKPFRRDDLETRLATLADTPPS
jgi:PAS domain S-box-containing protein